MSYKNTFEQQAKEYLGIQGGSIAGKPATVLTSDILEVGDNPGRHIQIGADSAGQSYVDFKSNEGYAPTDYDSRLISIGGTGWNGAGTFTLNANNFSVPALRSYKYSGGVVGGVAPFFLLDYGSQVVTAGLNQITTITFTVNLFTSAPKVILQVVDDGPGVQIDAFTTYVETTTADTCLVRGYGNISSGFTYNWLALGV